jgi:protoporphyrinogen/coproporphyrinogen III oxidase
MTAVPHVIVCGAGLTGLTTAWHLRQRGIDVTVLESGDIVGGVVGSTKREGYLVEHGPNSCMLTPELAAMVDSLGLTPLLRHAAPQAQRRYIVRGGRALAVPMSPFAMMRSPLFSPGAKLRMLAEPFIARRIASDDESVASFVRRRLGDEPLTWAVDPFVSGVYAGDPELLSVRHAFPRLSALERDHGSLLRGAIAGAKTRRTTPADSRVGSSRTAIVSFMDGMATLPLALADDIGAANIFRRTRVVAVDHEHDGPMVIVERDDVQRVIRADAVVSTVPLHALSQIALGPAAAAPLTQLATVVYPPVVSLALGFRRSDVGHALDGFGCLIPSAEQRHTLGVLFSSTLFDGRAPDGYVLLTCFLGGTRQPLLGALSTTELLELVQPELASLLGVTGAPKFVQHTVWPHAIPQYNRGHDMASQAAAAVESAVPGLIVDGQFRRGVSVGDCIAAGATIAARADDMARRNTERSPGGRARDAVNTPVAPAAVA